MLNLDVYPLRLKQNFMAFLNQFEAEGITDIRFVRERLQMHISNTAGVIPGEKRVRVRAQAKVKVTSGIRCSEPGCNELLRYADTGSEDIVILVCPKCRFSKVVE